MPFLLSESLMKMLKIVDIMRIFSHKLSIYPYTKSVNQKVCKFFRKFQF